MEGKLLLCTAWGATLAFIIAAWCCPARAGFGVTQPQTPLPGEGPSHEAAAVFEKGKRGKL